MKCCKSNCFCYYPEYEHGTHVAKRSSILRKLIRILRKVLQIIIKTNTDGE